MADTAPRDPRLQFRLQFGAFSRVRVVCSAQGPQRYEPPADRPEHRQDELDVAAGTAARADDTIACMWRTGDWRDSPWYFVVGGVAIALGGLGAIAGDSSRPSWSRWLAVAGMVIGVAVPVYVLWRRYLRSGRGRHGKQ